MFDVILEFLKIYYREIISILSALVCLIIFLCKKKTSINVIDNIELQLVVQLPSFIRVAEKSGLSGQDKLDLVLSLSLHYIRNLLKRSLKEDEVSLFTQFIVDEVESILTTPQKKGD